MKKLFLALLMSLLFAPDANSQWLKDKFFTWFELSEENSMVYDVDSIFKIEIGVGFTGQFPKEIVKYRNLKVLSIQNTGITQIPNEILELKNLESLSLYNNVKLVSIPDGILGLPNLTALSVFNSPISNFPMINGNGDYSNLEVLDFGLTEIVSIPEQIGLLVNLIHLGVYGWHGSIDTEYPEYNIEGKASLLAEVPKQLGALSNLSTINFSYSQINTLPEELVNCNKLTEIYVNDTKIDHIPNFSENLTTDYLIYYFTLDNLNDKEMKKLKKNMFFDKTNKSEIPSNANFGNSTVEYIEFM